MSSRRGFGGRRYHNAGGRGKFGDGGGDGESSSGGREGGSQRRGHPSGLRGKAIGMYYAQKSREKKRPEDPVGPDISLSNQKIGEIRAYLQNCSFFRGHRAASEENDAVWDNFRKKFNHVRNTDLVDQLKRCISSKEEKEDKKEMLLNNFEATSLTNDPEYEEIQAFRSRLPCKKKEQEILQLINDNQVVLIKGETGCGKTTQVPQYLLEQARAEKKRCKVVCTQPRRISATSIAERVAREQGQRLGDSIGYHIRLDSVWPKSRDQSILYCTTGCILKFMETDPALLDMTHLILDEIHERDATSDILLGILKFIIMYRRDLKLVLMSATLKAEEFSMYFDNCPIVQVEGFTFPVEEHYLEDVLSTLKFTRFDAPKRRNEPIWAKYRRNSTQGKQEMALFETMGPFLPQLKEKYPREIVEALLNPTSEEINFGLLEELIFFISQTLPAGAILVFLPGYAQISTLLNRLKDSPRFPSHRYQIYPLHSLLSGSDQRSVFQRPPEGVRKIIIATNIAETSVTIDDIVYVINSGKRKFTTYDVENNIQELREHWVSRANATQRKGRAGRCQPGVCFHLYTRARESVLETDIEPEIQRIRLDEVILSLKLLGVSNVAEFMAGLMSPPETKVIKHSVNLLKRLNALDEIEKLTPLGYHLARIPVDPQSGKMILFGAIFCCLDPITSIAASLSFKDAFYNVMGKEKEVDAVKLNFARNSRSDHLMLANVIDEWRKAKRGGRSYFCRENFLSYQILNQLEDMKNQFCSLLKESRFVSTADPTHGQNNIHSSNEKVVRAVVCSGLYPNIARIKKVITRKNVADGIPIITTNEDRRCSIHPSSVNSKQRSFNSNYLVYHMKQKSTQVYILDSTSISPYSILFFGDLVETNVNENYISVAGYLKFKCDATTQQLIVDMRNALEILLQKKVWSPSPVDWDGDEGKLMKAIIHLITIEGRLEYDSTDDEDFDK